MDRRRLSRSGAFTGANPHHRKLLPAQDLHTFATTVVAARAKSESYIDWCVAAVDWGAYDIVGFTVAFQQTCASLSLARRIKARHPSARIVFGGANREGVMGATILKRFKFVDLCFPARRT